MAINTVQTRRLGYIGDTRSDIWIARETGIPRSTLGYVRRGERRLPTQYRAAVRNLYQREAYRRLREVGVSSIQARRFSWYTVKKVRAVTDIVNKLVADLTHNRVISLIANPENEYTVGDYDKLFGENYQYIRDALRKSEKPVEHWEDYSRPRG